MIIKPAVREQLLKDLRAILPNWSNDMVLESNGSVTYKVWTTSMVDQIKYGRILNLIQGYKLLNFTLKMNYLEFTIDLP